MKGPPPPSAASPGIVAPVDGIGETEKTREAEILRHDRKKHHTRVDMEYNIFRDSAVRYLGYCNEVGESFRYQFPRLVLPSYGVAFAYCLADAATSGRRAYDYWAVVEAGGPASALFDSAVDTADVLVWQSLASVAIPGAVINGVVRAARFAVGRSPVALPVVAATWIPTGIGLGSIPFIVAPIDHFVDLLMENTFRTVQWDAVFGAAPGVAAIPAENKQGNAKS